MMLFQRQDLHNNERHTEACGGEENVVTWHYEESRRVVAIRQRYRGNENGNMERSGVCGRGGDCPCN
jgi:hypothetical protein